MIKDKEKIKIPLLWVLHCQQIHLLSIFFLKNKLKPPEETPSFPLLKNKIQPTQHEDLIFRISDSGLGQHPIQQLEGRSTVCTRRKVFTGKKGAAKKSLAKERGLFLNEDMF